MKPLTWIHWSLKETVAIFECLDYQTNRKLWWYHWCSAARVILICFTGMLNLLLLAQTVSMTATWQYPLKMCFTKIVVKMLIFINTIRIYKYIGRNLWICQQDTDTLAGFQDPFSCNEISVKSSLLWKTY